MKIKSILILVGMVLSLAARATEYTWIGSASDDPMEKSNYKVGSAEASQLPGTGDTLFLKKGGVWRITDSDGSFDQFKDLAIIAGMDGGVVRGACTVIVEVASSPAAMSSAFTASSGSLRYVTLRKLGAGTLSLTGKNLTSTGPKYYNQYCALSVEEGAVVLPQDVTAKKNCYLASAFVAKDASLVLFGNNGYTRLNEALEGSGLITNYYSDTSQLYISGGPGVFSGRIQGKIDLYLTGDLRLTGTENNCKLQSIGGFKGTDGAGTLGVNVLTTQDDGRTSVILPGTSTYSLGGAGSAARLMFCGNTAAQTADRNLYLFSSEAAPVVIDGGAYGGVTFTGYWALPPANNEAVMMHRICLTGSNTAHECVLNNKFFNRDRDGQTYTAHITKDGPGIWHFKHNAERKLAGGIAVEDGTLRFDTIAEKGEICSLGTSTILYEPFTGLFDDTAHPPVPYAFRIGGGDDPTKEGVFEYTGTAAVSITSRLAVVSGRARLRNASSKPFDFSGVSSIGANGGTLTLDGAGTGDVLRNVSDGDGAGPLGIAKDGDGTWALDGNLPFTGPVEVKRGTLVVTSNRKYDWYKFTIKENYSVVSNLSASYQANRQVYLSEIGLYAANGQRQNLALTLGEHAQVGEYEGTLLPGQVAYGMSIGDDGNPDSLTSLFDQSRDTGLDCIPKKMLDKDDESTWVSVVMRLSAEALPIVAFDFGGPRGASVYQKGPRVFSVSVSADGKNWQDLHTEEDAHHPVLRTDKTYSYWWNGGNLVGASGAKESDDPCPIQVMTRETRTVLPDGMAASVDAGATLKVVGETLAVKKLILDANEGAGTIENVDFAETGVIDLRNFAADSPLQFKYTLQDVSGFLNVGSWTVLKDGVEARNLAVSATDDGTVTIARSGLILIVR